MDNLIPPLPECKPASRSRPENGDIAEIPVGFDPVANPILAEHFFGLSPAEFHLRHEAKRWILKRRVRRSLLGQIPVQSRSRRSSSRRSSSPRLLASAGT